MYQSIAGKNVLTVLVAKPSEEETLRKKMFFCPYTKNITLQYQGDVKAIVPGYDPEETPQFLIKPQRLEHNIQYSFRESSQDSPGVDFWIQDQYFMEEHVKTYFCFNCQAPQLYFSGNKAVFFQNKAEIKRGQGYVCANPMCKESLTYLGIVKIKPVQ